MSSETTHKFNLDELEPPKFLTEEFIRKFLVDAERNDELRLNKFSIEPGTKVGDHYGSIMFKIIVSYESRANNIMDRRFLLKTVPEGEGSKKELLEAVPMFENEIRMYTETLPAMEKILSQCGEKCWWPRLVYCDKESKILIFDDLTQQNYKMAYKPLNYYSVIPVAEKCWK